jgi:hypothetical protein
MDLEASGDVCNRSPTPVDANEACENDKVRAKRAKRTKSTPSTPSSGRDGGCASSSPRRLGGRVGGVQLNPHYHDHEVSMSPASSAAASTSMGSLLKQAVDQQTANQQQKLLDNMQRVVEMDVLRSESDDMHFKLEDKMDTQHKCATPCGVWSGPDSNGEVVQVRVCSQLSSAR